MLLSAGTTLAAMLAKPSFGIAFLPALAVMTAWFVWKKRRLDWRLLILGQIVPLLIAFVYQLVLLYILPDPEGSSIILSFFGAESVWSAYLPLKLLLSLLFPLSVLFILRRRIHLDDELVLALIAFGMALIHLYFFAESGERFPHGNFRWGAQITLFILFAVLVRRLIALGDDPPHPPPFGRLPCEGRGARGTWRFCRHFVPAKPPNLFSSPPSLPGKGAGGWVKHNSPTVSIKEGDPDRGSVASLPPLSARSARPRLWPAYAMYLLHLAAGIAYYIYAYVQPNYN